VLFPNDGQIFEFCTIDSEHLGFAPMHSLAIHPSKIIPANSILTLEGILQAGQVCLNGQQWLVV
jgi:hypothetical protein